MDGLANRNMYFARAAAAAPHPIQFPNWTCYVISDGKWKWNWGGCPPPLAPLSPVSISVYLPYTIVHSPSTRLPEAATYWWRGDGRLLPGWLVVCGRSNFQSWWMCNCQAIRWAKAALTPSHRPWPLSAAAAFGWLQRSIILLGLECLTGCKSRNCLDVGAATLIPLESRTY